MLEKSTCILVILAEELLITYIQQFGIIIAFAIMNSVSFYLLYKCSNLDFTEINNQ